MQSVFLQQQIFRVLLRAMSRPGLRCALPVNGEGGSVELLRAVLETLLDIEVTFALAGGGQSLSEQEITRWTHARASAVEEADFLVVHGAESGGLLDLLKRGRLDAPDRSATVIFLMPEAAIRKDPAAAVRFSGPGVDPEQSSTAVLSGVPRREFSAIRKANADYPCGIDCFFLYPDGAVVGLPRSVTVEEG
jgi:phosphonate C-P lyase system protein PhnH